MSWMSAPSSSVNAGVPGAASIGSESLSDSTAGAVSPAGEVPNMAHGGIVSASLIVGLSLSVAALAVNSTGAIETVVASALRNDASGERPWHMLKVSVDSPDSDGI